MLVPGPDIGLEFQTLATFVSAILYGMVISLYVLCCRALFKGRRNYSIRKKWFLLGYSTVLLLLSTIAAIEDIRIIIISTFRVGLTAGMIIAQIFELSSGDLVLPFTIWSADIFMVSRDSNNPSDCFAGL